MKALTLSAAALLLAMSHAYAEEAPKAEVVTPTQQLLNKGIQSAISGAINGDSGKQILKNTGNDVTADAKQQLQQSTGEWAKKAPTADSNPLGALATGMAAQAASDKASQAVKGGNGALAGQVASDVVKGLSGSIQEKMTAKPAAPEAAPAPAPTETPATAPATTGKKAAKKPAKKAAKAKKK